MGAFLKPLRRKIGVLTLVVSCILLAGWIRSRFIGDFVAFSTSHYPLVTISSRLGTIEFAWYREYSLQTKPQWSASPIRSEHGNANAKDSFAYAWGIGEVTTAGRVISKGTTLTVHFWAIVLPPTLLSAWLLLSKPRIAKPPAIGEK